MPSTWNAYPNDIYIGGAISVDNGSQFLHLLLPHDCLQMTLVLDFTLYWNFCGLLWPSFHFPSTLMLLIFYLKAFEADRFLTSRLVFLCTLSVLWKGTPFNRKNITLVYCNARRSAIFYRRVMIKGDLHFWEVTKSQYMTHWILQIFGKQKPLIEEHCYGILCNVLVVHERYFEKRTFSLGDC